MTQTHEASGHVRINADGSSSGRITLSPPKKTSDNSDLSFEEFARRYRDSKDKKQLLFLMEWGGGMFIDATVDGKQYMFTIDENTITPREPWGKKAKPEIEITPEMIEAGKAEIATFDRDHHDWADAAIAVYRAMAQATSMERDNTQ